MLTARWSSFTRCPIHLAPHVLISVTLLFSKMLSVKSIRPSSSSASSCKDLNFFVILLHKQYNFIQHSLISFSSPLPIDSFIVNSNCWMIHHKGMRSKCSSTRRANKLLLHPILIDDLYVQIENELFQHIVIPAGKRSTKTSFKHICVG